MEERAATFNIVGGGEAAAFDGEDATVRDDGREDIRQVLHLLPDDVCLGDVAAAAGLDGAELVHGVREHAAHDFILFLRDFVVLVGVDDAEAAAHGAFGELGLGELSVFVGILSSEEFVVRLHLHAVVLVAADVPSADEQQVFGRDGTGVGHACHAADGPALFAVFEIIAPRPQRAADDEFFDAAMLPDERC